MSARKNLDKIVARSLALEPVSYTIDVPGVNAVQLSFIAIKFKCPVEEVILRAIEDYCYIEMLGESVQ